MPSNFPIGTPPIDITLDTLGGHPSPIWSPGSCFENEGRYLYKTVREMQPDVIVEVGRWDGCSTSHLALGCMHNNRGRVFSIDIASGTGAKIPPELLPWIQFVNRDIFTLTAAELETITGGPLDLLLEDGAHSPGFTAHVLKTFKARRVIVHDYMHWDCQNTVKAECDLTLGKPHEIFFEPPSDCGYAVYKFD